MQKLPIV